MGGALKRVQTFRGPQNLSLRHFQAQIFVESCDFEVIHLSMLMFQRLPYRISEIPDPFPVYMYQKFQTPFTTINSRPLPHLHVSDIPIK